MKRWLLVLATAASMFSLTGCGYNDFQRLDEKSKAVVDEIGLAPTGRADRPVDDVVIESISVTE